MEGFAAGGAGGSRCCLPRDVDTALWGKSDSLSARPSPGQTSSTYSGGEVAMVAALLVAIATTALVAKIRLKERDGHVPTMDEYASIPLPVPNKGSPYVDLSLRTSAPDSPTGTPLSQHTWVPGYVPALSLGALPFFHSHFDVPARAARSALPRWSRSRSPLTPPHVLDMTRTFACFLVAATTQSRHSSTELSILGSCLRPRRQRSMLVPQQTARLAPR